MTKKPTRTRFQGVLMEMDRLCGLVGPHPDLLPFRAKPQFPHCQHRKPRVVLQVALPQSARLHRQPEQPFRGNHVFLIAIMDFGSPKNLSIVSLASGNKLAIIARLSRRALCTSRTASSTF